MVKIIKSIGSVTNSSGYLEVQLIANTETGKVDIEVSKTIIERYDLTDFSNAMTLYNDLKESRSCVSLKDLL